MVGWGGAGNGEGVVRDERRKREVRMLGEGGGRRNEGSERRRVRRGREKRGKLKLKGSEGMGRERGWAGGGRNGGEGGRGGWRGGEEWMYMSGREGREYVEDEGRVEERRGSGGKG